MIVKIGILLIIFNLMNLKKIKLLMNLILDVIIVKRKMKFIPIIIYFIDVEHIKLIDAYFVNLFIIKLIIKLIMKKKLYILEYT